MSLTTIIILFSFFAAANTAKPLKLPDSNKTMFEYSFTVDWKMTMAWYNESTGNNIATLLKYDVDRAKYFVNTEDGGSSEEPKSESKEKKSKENKEEEEEDDECAGKYQEVPQSSAFYLDDVVTVTGKHDRMIMINGKVPAPTIVAPYGSEVVVKVSNRLAMEGVSIHFHGIDKKNQWFMDGTSRLQQCPIGAANDFTYRFKADVAGTHFYHGHLGMDRTVGLYGVIIVVPQDRSVLLHNNTKIVPDIEYSMVLFDWNLVSTTEMWYNHIWETKKFVFGTKENKCLKRSVAIDGTKIGGSYPLSAITINDKGWHNQQDILRRPNKLDLESFLVEEGQKTYLFRVINAGQAHPMMISVEDHQVQIVSTDGVSVKPVLTDFLILYPGERYDFVLVSKTKADKNVYFLIVETLDFYGSNEKTVEPFYALAKIQYKQKSSTQTEARPPDVKQNQRCSNASKCVVTNCPFPIFPPNFNRKCVNTERLEYIGPLKNEVLRQSYAPDDRSFEEYFINMNFEEVVNGWLFQYPKGPPYFYPNNESLVTRSCTKENWKGKRNSRCMYTLNITLGSVVQLALFNTMGSEGPNDKEGYHHPVHLHGSHFYVVKVGYAGYNKTTGALETINPDIACARVNEECDHPTWRNSSWLRGNIPDMNLNNPVLKDTVVLPLGGYVVLRFKADNPGWWVLHCHIMEHHMAGMAFALRVGDHDQMPKPPSNFPKCGVFDSLYDNTSTSD